MNTPISAQQQRPSVMVYIGDDEPTRGDSHGFTGIGRALAEKLGASFHVLEDKALLSLYPQSRTAADGLTRYIDEHGAPDVLFTRADNRDTPVLLTLRDTLKISAINEKFSQQMTGSTALVGHHLTPALLAAQGKAFRTEHPAEKNETLVAVLMAQDGDLDFFADKLVAKSAAHGKARIFVCACWRTPEEDFDVLMQRLEKTIAARGFGDRLRLTGYHPDKDAGTFNPYIGLLDTAYHVLLAGPSRSMLSESLAAGKPVMTYSAGLPYPELVERGLALHFNDCAMDKRFETARITPVDITGEIADKIAQKTGPALKARYPSPNNRNRFA